MDIRSDCPISYSLDVFGDKWTLLILRDMIFGDKASFLEWRSSDEKIAPSVLTNRINLLMQEGLIIRKTSDQNASKFIHYLTEKGIKIIPILVDMIEFGTGFIPAKQAQENLKKIKKNRTKFIEELQKKMRGLRITAIGK